MFEMMLAKLKRSNNAVWSNPKRLDIKFNEEDSEYTPCKILKGASQYLHKQMDIKPTTSAEIYKKSEDIWIQLKNTQLQKIAEDPNEHRRFNLDSLDNIYLLDDNNNIIDMLTIRDKESALEFEEALEKFNIDISTTEKTSKFFTDGKNGLIKLVFYDKKSDITQQQYTPVVLLEFNNEKSIYKVYTGILIYEIFTFIPNITIYGSYDRLSDLIKGFDIDNVLSYSKDTSNELYESYLQFLENKVEISARELIALLKKVGYKLDLRTDDQLDEVQAIQDPVSNTKIQEFFNTFTLTTGETAYDILSLSELKKIFRYNKLTLLDVLGILSKEYLTFDGTKIDADILSGIVYNLFDKQNDKKQAESIKTEINKN